MIPVKNLRIKRILIILCIILIVAGLQLNYLKVDKEAVYTPMKTGLQEFYSEKLKMGYYLNIPDGYNIKQKNKCPLIIHMHGSNAVGNGKDQLIKVKAHGLKALIYGASSKNCIILAPQSKSQWKSSELDELLDEITAAYSIDNDRIYLTGVSMGGTGTWSYAVNERYKLAAIVPVCGDFFLSDQEADEIKDLPIWLFHGDKDNSVPVQKAYDAIGKLKGKNSDFKYTIYKDRGHSIWNEVYCTPELYDWMFKQVRKI